MLVRLRPVHELHANYLSRLAQSDAHILAVRVPIYHQLQHPCTCILPQASGTPFVHVSSIQSRSMSAPMCAGYSLLRTFTPSKEKNACHHRSAFVTQSYAILPSVRVSSPQALRLPPRVPDIPVHKYMQAHRPCKLRINVSTAHSTMSAKHPINGPCTSFLYFISRAQNLPRIPITIIYCPYNVCTHIARCSICTLGNVYTTCSHVAYTHGKKGTHHLS